MNFLEHFDHPGKKQDKEHFNHLIQMALADGKIEDTELNRKTLKVFYRLLIKLRFAMHFKKNDTVSLP